MIRKTIAGIAVAVMLPFMAACNLDFPSACEGLSASDQDREAAANGYEVEREDSQGNECELSHDGNSWSVDS